MSSPPSPADDQFVWGPCPIGTVGNLVTRMRQDRTRRSVVQGLFVATSCLLLAAGSFMTWRHLGSPRITEMTCAQVQQLLPDYIARALDRDLTASIAAHLTGCEHCREIEGQMQHRLQARSAIDSPYGRELAVLVRTAR